MGNNVRREVLEARIRIINKRLEFLKKKHVYTLEKRNGMYHLDTAEGDNIFLAKTKPDFLELLQAFENGMLAVIANLHIK